MCVCVLIYIYSVLPLTSLVWMAKILELKHTVMIHSNHSHIARRWCRLLIALVGTCIGFLFANYGTEECELFGIQSDEFQVELWRIMLNRFRAQSLNGWILNHVESYFVVSHWPFTVFLWVRSFHNFAGVLKHHFSRLNVRKRPEVSDVIVGILIYLICCLIGCPTLFLPQEKRSFLKVLSSSVHTRTGGTHAAVTNVVAKPDCCFDVFGRCAASISAWMS